MKFLFKVKYAPVLFLFAFMVAPTVHAATPTSLGAAAPYAVLAGTFTNTSATTTINGDVGYTTVPDTLPIINGHNYGSGVPTPTARTNANSALVILNAESPCNVDLGDAPVLSGTLAPGIYCGTGVMSIGSGGVILSGAGTYIFRTAGAFNTVANSVVTLMNGAYAGDIFWTMGGATTLGANSTFVGTIIQTASAITVGGNTTWTGRALATAGAVTTGFGVTINVPFPIVLSIARVSGTPTNAASVNFTVTFNATTTGVDTSDFALANTGTAAGTIASVTPISGSAYTVTVNAITGNGSLGLNLVDNDSIIDEVGSFLGGKGAGNGNFIGEIYVIDNLHPTVALTSSVANPTNLSPFNVTSTFSEPVTGFLVGDVTVGNGLASNFVVVSSLIYTFDITPSGQGLVTVDVATSTAFDLAGNPNDAAPRLSRTFDSLHPTVALTSSVANPTNLSSFNVTSTFSEPVTGFLVGDVTVGNGLASNFVTVSSLIYTFDITPSGQGLVTVDVATSTASDLAGNPNDAAPRLSRTFDSQAPSAPVANPIAGTYSSTQSVTLTTNDGTATIRYTTNGSLPSCSLGTIYTSAISISTSETLKSIACDPLNNASAISSDAYTISAAVISGGGGGGGMAPQATINASGPRVALDFSINNGAVVVTDPLLQISFNADTSTVSSYAISLNASLNDATLVNYKPATTFLLPSVLGSYTVYVRFYSIAGQSSSIISHTILLQSASAPVTTTPYTAKICHLVQFNKDLKFGSSGEDVKQLQIFLNAHGFIVAKAGAGSRGNESTYFGSATKAALIAFQKANNLTLDGIFAGKTRLLVNGMICSFPMAAGASAYDSALATRMQGRILLQVESRGEAWYVRSKDLKRYYMKDGAAAYSIMRFFSQGIADVDLAKIPQVSSTAEMKAASSVCASNSLGNRFRGEILLQVQQHGEAWYVNPVKCRAIYMKDGAVAYEVMRFLGLGITDVDLQKIPLGE